MIWILSETAPIYVIKGCYLSIIIIAENSRPCQWLSRCFLSIGKVNDTHILIFGFSVYPRRFSVVSVHIYDDGIRAIQHPIVPSADRISQRYALKPLCTFSVAKENYRHKNSPSIGNFPLQFNITVIILQLFSIIAFKIAVKLLHKRGDVLWASMNGFKT